MRVNINVATETMDQVNNLKNRGKGLNVSRICQNAIQAYLNKTVVRRHPVSNEESVLIRINGSKTWIRVQGAIGWSETSLSQRELLWLAKECLSRIKLPRPRSKS